MGGAPKVGLLRRLWQLEDPFLYDATITLAGVPENAANAIAAASGR